MRAVVELDARTRQLAEELAEATVARIRAEERTERAGAALARYLESHHGAAGRGMLTAVVSFFVGMLVGLMLRRKPTDPPVVVDRAARVEFTIGPVSEQ